MKNKLRKIRESRGMTAAQVGKEVGVSGTQIQRIETGDRELKLEMLLSLCGVLGVTADEIIDVPLSGINKAKCDDVLMSSVIGFVLEACDRHDLKATKKQIAKWTSLVYNATTDLHLSATQTRGLANLLVRIEVGEQ